MKEIKYDLTSCTITGLSLITSCGCNLDCKYCKIAQGRHNNPNADILQKNTIQGLKDGSFIDTTKKALDLINQSSKNIDAISFWGQEPTLTLDLITQDLPHWFQVFPKWNRCFFSTNTIAFIDRIYDFICGLDETTPHPFTLQIQFSYDGEYGTTNSRGASGSIIYNNIIELLEKLNNTTLNNIKCEFHLHGVVSQDLVFHMHQDINNFIEYYQNILDYNNFLVKHNRNNKVFCVDCIDLALENPIDASTDFGNMLASVLRMSEHLNPNVFNIPKDSFYVPFIDKVSEGATFNVFDDITSILRNDLETDNLNTAIKKLTDDPIYKRELFNRLNPICYCGTGTGELKVMYDGTFVNCQNHIYDLDLNSLPKEHQLDSLVKRELVSHHYFINPFTATEKELQRYFYLFNTAKFQSLDFAFNSTITMMKLLLLNHQIDESYYDEFKLIKHGLLMSIMNTCSYNQQMTTGSIFLHSLGFIRLEANGVLDCQIKSFNKRMEGEVI